MCLLQNFQTHLSFFLLRFHPLALSYFVSSGDIIIIPLYSNSMNFAQTKGLDARRRMHSISSISHSELHPFNDAKTWKDETSWNDPHHFPRCRHHDPDSYSNAASATSSNSSRRCPSRRHFLERSDLRPWNC
mmetsp:Transcript_21469/g.40671  ORF Transcript_21469/g.40671 Transcript_21469/m.40671 type:complete len:132 (+) Transcript_21469:131-526(+)